MSRRGARAGAHIHAHAARHAEVDARLRVLRDDGDEERNGSRAGSGKHEDAINRYAKARPFVAKAYWALEELYSEGIAPRT